MARRPPSALRREQNVRIVQVDGLSAATVREIAFVEQRDWPGFAENLRTYRRSTSRTRAQALHAADTSCGYPECCPRPGEVRDALESVRRSLGRRGQREVDAVLAPMDAHAERLGLGPAG